MQDAEPVPERRHRRSIQQSSAAKPAVSPQNAEEQWKQNPSFIPLDIASNAPSQEVQLIESQEIQIKRQFFQQALQTLNQRELALVGCFSGSLSWMMTWPTIYEGKYNS